jgi:potassium-transporting ATPase KdpC subunit
MSKYSDHAAPLYRGRGFSFAFFSSATVAPPPSSSSDLESNAASTPHRHSKGEPKTSMTQHIRTAVLITLVTTLIFGILYPLAVTGLGRLLFPAQSNGSMVMQNGQLIGSRLIGQPFIGPGYFHPRPSAAGSGYDPVAASGGASNLGPTNKQLTDRIKGDVDKLHAENPNAPIPVDLVTTSGSGLDPDISPAAADFQVPRVARERHMTESDLRALVAKHTQGRQFGIFGEPRVNVLELNFDLDSTHPKKWS